MLKKKKTMGAHWRKETRFLVSFFLPVVPRASCSSRDTPEEEVGLVRYTLYREVWFQALDG